MENKHLNGRKGWSILSMVAGVAAASTTYGLLAPEASRADSNARSKVVLYSEGRVVREWTAVGTGHMDHGTYVFSVRDGVAVRQVRISGTFSAEELR